MAVNADSQNGRILNVLRDGEWHSAAEIMLLANSGRLNSRISELRRRYGYVIEHRIGIAQHRDGAHQYRLGLGASPALPEFPSLVTRTPRVTLDRDSIPRDDAHRYRIYVLDENENLLLVGSAPTPTWLGVKLIELAETGQIERACVGILDSHGIDKKTATGRWLINPFNAKLI